MAGVLDRLKASVSQQIAAGGRAAALASQNAVPTVLRDVQRLLGASELPGRLQGGPMADIQNVPLDLLGGVTLARVRQMHEMIRDARLTRKNLWFVRVTDPNPPRVGYAFQQGGIGGVLDLLALEVSYSPFTLTSEKKNIGSAVLDGLNGSESVELTLTTMDDEAGTVKRWFEGKCLQAARPDGTFGVPADYCVNIEVVHAVSVDDAPVRADPYKSMMTMRPQALQIDLSRREQAFQELTLSFSEFDTFISAIGGIL